MYRSNIAVFFSAGNDGVVNFPARLSTVMAVGSTDDNDSVRPGSGKGPALDIVAPGGGIPTWDMMGTDGYIPNLLPTGGCDYDNNYNCKFGGTSSSAPIAAGIAALVLSRPSAFRDSTDRVGIIRRILEGSAEDKGPSGYDTTYGYGRVNAYRALLSVIHGDVNNDAKLNVLDVIVTGNIVFQGGHAVLDDRTADVNCDGVTNVLDVTYLVNCVFKSGPRPVICFRY